MVNTLVMHKKLKTLGIGCVAKELKHSCKVNFGLEDTIMVKKDLLEEVDVSECKTISFKEFSSYILKSNPPHNYCIVGNELRHFVGIGWIKVRAIIHDDLMKYPRVI
jgi:hypothetical protein